MAEYVRRKSALGEPGVQALVQSLRASPLVGESPLGGTFRGSRGFSLIFTEAGRGEVGVRFPALRAFVDEASDVALHRALLPWRARLGRQVPPRANAYYLNLLLLGPGEGVGRHVDATLRDICGDAHAMPARVHVLYLQETPGPGGDLRLFRHRMPVGVIRPRAGELVVFRGDLAHEVTACPAAALGQARMSLVLEQYCLGPDALARMPRLRVCSQRGFGAYLRSPGAAEPANEGGPDPFVPRRAPRARAH